MAPVWAQAPAAAPEGVAWDVRGIWRMEGRGAPLRTGDAIPPGSLVQPDAVAAQHAMIVLLPDGQRDFYECFTLDDCARGFRVPLLFQDPEPFAVDMLARIRALLLRGNRGFSSASAIDAPLGSPRDEVLAVLGPDKQVVIDGLATKLGNGRYTYDARPLDPALPNQLHLALQKTAPTISLPLPAPGLYVVSITDDMSNLRMHIFLAAVGPAQETSFKKAFHDAKVLMQKWNDDFYGWPVHEFQWAYLESLVVGRPPTADSQQAAAAHGPERMASVAAEPAFSPKPGALAGDTEIALRCDTPGATIHYTVDYSQPLAASPVYRAPIVIKGSGLTIKAFASAPGKKDSAVVNGTFRIRK